MALVTYYANLSAVGDACSSVPTVKALIAEKKLYKLLVPARLADIFRLCGVDESYIVCVTPEEAKAFDLNGSTGVAANMPGHAAYRIHLVDLFSVFPINAILKPEEKCAAALPEMLPTMDVAKKYVVIGIGYANMSRRLPVKAYNEIVKFCKGKGYEVVLLGAQRQNMKTKINFEEHPREGCIDLIDKTDIPESVAIMAKAACVIGVDSGMIYLAALTDVPIVCGYSFVDPHYRAPYRHGEKGWRFYPVESRSECRYCSNDLAMFGVSFDSECPKGRGFACSAFLDAQDFITAIKLALGGKPGRGSAAE